MKKNKNAKAELLEHISGKGTVVYVQVIYMSSKYIDQLETRVARGTLDEMLPVLDFEYDPGYGGQAQEGTIWFADGSWSERERDDYDGRMLWVHRLRPALPTDQQQACSAWVTLKQATPEEGEWVLHTYAGERAPEYGLYARGRFWRNDGPESLLTTHWLRIPMIEHT